MKKLSKKHGINFGISFENRALEFLVRQFNVDIENKSIEQIKSEIFQIFEVGPIQNLDYLLDLMPSFHLYLEEDPFGLGRSEKDFRLDIRESIQHLITNRK